MYYKYMDRDDRIIELLTSMKESLEQEIHDFRADITNRFDTQAARLERHAALWQTGTRWSSRMDAWAEKIDANADSLSREIAAMKERLADLERRTNEKR